METLADRVAKMLEKAINPLASFINRIGTSLVLVIVGTISADVCLRYLLNYPIPGTIEITEFVLPIMVFFSVAHAAVEKRHVGVDLVYEHLGTKSRATVDVVTSMLSAYVMGVVTWQLFLYAIHEFETSERGDILGLPHWPAVMSSAVGCGVLALVLFSGAVRAVGELKKFRHKRNMRVGASIACALMLILLPWAMEHLGVELSNLYTGLLFVALLFLIMLLRMPIAFCMAFIGLQGLWYMKGISKTLPLMAFGPWMATSDWNYSVIPTFVVMGMFAFYSGISKDLFETGYKWLGHKPGGLALTTIAACGGFASICGCSTTTAATMSTIALPEMRRFKYRDSLSAGALAAGGTLGILIPPSIGFMVYGVITEESISKLFIAGIIPGLMLVLLFFISIYIRCRINPSLGPSGPVFSFKEKIHAIRKTWQMFLLFVVVIGGLYFGVFGPNEAGAIGALGSLVIGVALGRLSWQKIKEALLASGGLTAMIFMILACVKILSYFIALTKIPFLLPNFIISYNLSPYWVLLFILILFFILGCLMNVIPMMILTLPILYPAVVQAGFDPIWFGVIMVIMMEMGQITPPVGINVFVISGVATDIPMGSIFRGIAPFLLAQVCLLIILILFPSIATFLPGLMK